jgi:uncharacterized membrane protein required for colicin V production
MVLNLGILLIVAACALHGYVKGLARGVGSFISIIVGLLLAMQACDDLARFFTSNPQPSTPVVLASFFVILGLTWLALYFGRKLLMKTLGRHEQDTLDQFLGGAVGLGRGVALVWLSLAMLVGVFPASMGVVSRSTASMRLLEVSGAPRAAQTELVSGGIAASADSTGMKCSVALRGRLRQYDPGTK